jgi:hypothetical protein
VVIFSWRWNWGGIEPAAGATAPRPALKKFQQKFTEEFDFPPPPSAAPSREAKKFFAGVTIKNTINFILSSSAIADSIDNINMAQTSKKLGQNIKRIHLKSVCRKVTFAEPLIWTYERDRKRQEKYLGCFRKTGKFAWCFG